MVLFLAKHLGLVFFVWALAGCLHWCLFALIALLPPRKGKGSDTGRDSWHFVVVVPGYRSGAELVEAVRSVMLQDYSPKRTRVIVVADHCEESVCARCEREGAHVLRVAFRESTKSVSLKEALRYLEQWNLPEECAVVIVDADNLLAPGFLRETALALAAGARAVQGRRVARNWQNKVAQLDMISEALNNAVFRRARVRCVLPSALIGSAMAFDYLLFAQEISRLEAVGGFDKELEMRLAQDGIHIAYAERAVCFDEKLSDAEAFGIQKRRWLSAQLVYLKRMTLCMASLFPRLSGAVIDKWLQWLFPPRVLLLALLVLLAPAMALMGMVGPAVACAAGVAGMLALHLALLWREGLLALVPQLALTAVRLTCGYAGLVMRLRRVNRSFLHTPHGDPVSIEQLARELDRAPLLPAGVRDALCLPQQCAEACTTTERGH